MEKKAIIFLSIFFYLCEILVFSLLIYFISDDVHTSEVEIGIKFGRFYY